MTESRTDSDSALLQAGYRYGLSLTHHIHDAEDLVQQAWFKLCRKYGTVKNRAILYTTIRNLFYDKCKRGKIIYFESIEESDDQNFEDDNVDDSTVVGDLDILLANISVRQREMLYLNCVEGYTTDEIGKMLGCARGTVLSSLSRAKKKLQVIASREEGMSNHE